MDTCAFYKIRKPDINEIWIDYPLTKTRLIEQAIEVNKKLSAHRKTVIEKNPIFDQEPLQSKALDRVEEI